MKGVIRHCIVLVVVLSTVIFPKINQTLNFQFFVFDLTSNKPLTIPGQSTLTVGLVPRSQLTNLDVNLDVSDDVRFVEQTTFIKDGVVSVALPLDTSNLHLLYQYDLNQLIDLISKSCINNTVRSPLEIKQLFIFCSSNSLPYCITL